MNCDHLNDEQKKAVTHIGGPLLIIAGAGTGKTTVVTNRIAWLIEQGHIQPENILALTFTDKASGEMIDRVEGLIDVSYTDMRVSTFHAFCQWLLQQYGLDIGLPDYFDVLDTKAAWMLVRDNFDRFDLDYYRPKGNPYACIHTLIGHFSRCKDEQITPQEYMAYAEDMRLNTDHVEYEEEGKRLMEVARAYDVYNQLLREKGVMDFGDLLMFALELLQKRPLVLKELKERFSHILVDEFQDTNWIQYALIKILAGDGHGLVVVADDDQSIYKFRGASVANVMQFLADYPDTKRIALTTNYRSGQEILDCSHQFIQANNPERLEVKETIDKRLVAGSAIEAVVRGYAFGTQAQEDLFMMREIVRLGVFGCAILCRTNAQVQHYADVCEREGVAYHVHSQQGLFRNPMIMDCLSWLQVLDDPQNDVAWYRVLNNMRMPCPAADVAVLVGLVRQKRWSYVQALRRVGKDELSDEAKRWVTDMLARFDAHQVLMQETSSSGMCHLFFEEFGWFGYIASLSSGKEISRAMQLVAVLQAFLDEVVAFEERHNQVFVTHFLHYVSVLADAGYEGGIQETSEEPRDCVQLMTIHASKGLEFDYVFIPQLVHLRFPSTKRRESIAIPDELIKEILPVGDVHMQEERRLMYVAMTRARRCLIMSYAGDYGGKRLKKPSQFVEELGVIFNVHAEQIGARVITADVSREVEITPLNSFSYTSLRTFATCPLQYKFSHIVKIPTRGAGALSFGQSIHSTLERFYQRLVLMNSSSQSTLFGDEERSGALHVPSRDELLSIYKQSFVEDWYVSSVQKSEYYTHGEAILKSLYDRETKRGWVLPAYVEQSVAFSVGDAMLYGAIDRVDKEFDEYVIIDYKTGKPKTDASLSKDDRLQLLIYVIGLEKTLGIRARRCEFWYVEDGSTLVFEPSDEDVSTALVEIQKRIDDIQKSDFSAEPSQFNCSNCSFRSICEFRS